jgi:hypothetical protein
MSDVGSSIEEWLIKAARSQPDLLKPMAEYEATKLLKPITPCYGNEAVKVKLTIASSGTAHVKRFSIPVSLRRGSMSKGAWQPTLKL